MNFVSCLGNGFELSLWSVEWIANEPKQKAVNPIQAAGRVAHGNHGFHARNWPKFRCGMRWTRACVRFNIQNLQTQSGLNLHTLQLNCGELIEWVLNNGQHRRLKKARDDHHQHQHHHPHQHLRTWTCVASVPKPSPGNNIPRNKPSSFSVITAQCLWKSSYLSPRTTMMMMIQLLLLLL